MDGVKTISRCEKCRHVHHEIYIFSPYGNDKDKRILDAFINRYEA